MLALGATYYGAFFEEPRLVFILYLFAVSALVDGFQNVGIVDFFKDLELDKQFRFMLVTRVLVVLITWAVAFIWRNYWALVVGALLERVVPTIYSYRVHPYRPAFSLSMWRQIGGFSLWLMLNNFLTFLNGRSSTFVLGKLAGPAVVGNYTLSQRIIYLPGSEIAAPIRQAVYPGYAKLSGEPERLGDGFIRVFGLIMLAVVPISAALGLVVDPLVRVALGERWIPAIPIMQVLVLSSIFRVATANAGPLLFALNRPELVSLSNFVGLLVLIPLLIWGVSSAGAVGAAWAVAASSATTLVLNVHWARRSLNMGLGPLLQVSWRPLLGVTTMVVATQAAHAGLRELQIPVSELIRLCLLSGLAVTAYVTTVFLLWRMSGSPRAAERDLIGLLPHRVRKLLT
jgi:O-antigen/teichoic acid export membrane protein